MGTSQARSDSKVPPEPTELSNCGQVCSGLVAYSPGHQVCRHSCFVSGTQDRLQSTGERACRWELIRKEGKAPKSRGGKWRCGGPSGNEEQTQQLHVSQRSWMGPPQTWNLNLALPLTGSLTLSKLYSLGCSFFLLKGEVT